MRTPLAAASLAAALAVGSMLAASPAGGPPGMGDVIPPKDARMAWWRNARFGMFIHWGLYAIPAGEWHGKKDKGAGEWILTGLQVDPIEYEKELLPKFNPMKFDPKEWARMAKDGPTEAERADALAYLTGSMPLQFTDSRRIADTLLALRRNDRPLDWLANRPARLAALDQARLAAVARRLLRPEALAAVIAGQPQGL